MKIFSTFLAFFLLTLQFRVDGCLFWGRKPWMWRDNQHLMAFAYHQCLAYLSIHIYMHLEVLHGSLSSGILDMYDHLCTWTPHKCVQTTRWKPTMPKSTFFPTPPRWNCIDKVPWRFLKDPPLQERKISAGDSFTATWWNNTSKTQP